ncbi:hypothetical protein EXN22_22615 [Pseudomonas tructae]|uniref:CBM-cenC domain-containing protein n=1 Tax=Pseudomonas tructae TaxID=2518644 RepID=A0A411MNV2_9PSED|nr:hypothetical protein [Pseudomonas tructae]QBF28350.1 hypothetical protein EXN22_22615 [Pseudomonas tructae]
MENYVFDYTSFEQPGEAAWNGWNKGANGNMLKVMSEAGNHHLAFENFDGNLLGIILQKTLMGFTPGTAYSLSLRVKRLGQSPRTTTLSWHIGKEPLPTNYKVEDTNWHTLTWRFDATDSKHSFELIGRDESGHGNAPGADFIFDDIRIQPIEVKEDFDGRECKLQDPGARIELNTMSIYFLPDSMGKAGIYNDPSWSALHEKEGLVMCHGQDDGSYTQRLHIDLPGAYNSISFGWSYKHTSGEVKLYNTANELLWSYTLQQLHETISYTANDNCIARIELICRDWSYFDFFVFKNIP